MGAHLDKALSLVDADRVVELCMGLVDVPSPTGDERPLAEWIARELTASGVTAHVQPLDDRQANAWAEVGDPGDGPDLLLYSPIDTLTVGDAAEDVPWIGAELPDHAVPRARRAGDRVVGLGAQNPKGHAACVMAALECVAAAGVPLRGRLLGAFGAGGMPTNAIARLDGDRGGSGFPGDEVRAGRRNTGQGAGASFLLEQGLWADAAVIAKSGWSVATAEVGLAWIDVAVGGIHTYVGSRHRIPYRSAIVDAGRVAAHLESWFTTTYSRAHADDIVEPQAMVSSIRAGWWRMAAVAPATAELRCDVRLAPGQSPLDAWREVDAALEPLRSGEGISVTTRLALAIPGSATPADHWVATATVAAWEAVAGVPHVPATATSGATDANILRNRGIPTARVGLPKAADEAGELDFAAGMNTVDVAALADLTRVLVRLAVDVGSRSRDTP